MFPISQPFADALKKRARTWLLRADIDGSTYGKDKIVSLDIENNLAPADDFTIGAASISKMIIKIRAPDPIAVNARIVPYLSLSLAGLKWEEAAYPWEDADFSWDGTKDEWLPLGEFYIDKRERINNVWTYTCYDKLTFANAPYISSLSYPATLRAVWDEICTRLGYTYDSTVQINPSYTVPVAPTGYSYREVMGYIAGANSASVFVGKDGTIKFRRYAAAENPVFNMGLADYIRIKQTNPQRSITRIVVTYNKEDDLKVEAGTGDESKTLAIENPFVTQAIVNDLLTNLNGFSYIPVEMDARGYPQVDVGDRIEYGQQEGYRWMDATMAWQDADFPWDGITYHQTIALRLTFRFKGGLGMGISAPSQSFQQSEFPVQGKLSGQINQLNQTAVKQGRNYYGVTITRDQGLIVERDDHASRVVLNSDEFRFTADGEDALWFDVPNRKWKFSGTLQGVDGDFSGTITASSIIGGTIEGTNISGGTITGALIQTSITYPRSAMSSTERSFAVYKDEFHSLSILNLVGPNVPGIRFWDSSLSRTVYMYYDSETPEMIITVQGDLNIGASGDVIINGIPVNPTLNSLQSQINSLNSRVTALENQGST